MAFLTEKLISASGATEETDDDFNLVTGLYHFDGSNGAQNYTFLDSSSNSFSVTQAGNSTQGTFSPFSAEEGKWAAEFPVGEAGNQINPASGLGIADFALGTGAFTIECWIYVTADSYPYSRVWQIGPYFSSNNSVGLSVHDTDNSNKISFFAYAATGASRTCISTNATPENEWFHVAVTRDGTGDFRLFVNGNLDSTNTSYRTTDISPLGNPALAIGNGLNRFVEEPFEGFISNFRLVKGTAVYTSSFTVPTEPLTAITNTKLLTCCSNRFRDKSTSANTTTLYGSPKIKPFSPFAPSYSYSAATNGGSFHGYGISGDYASIAASSDFDVLSNGTFTIDFWFYRTNSLGTYADYVGIFNGVSAGVLIYQNGSTFDVYINGSTIFNVTHPSLNQWVHVALTRDGTTLRLFLNGVASGTSTASLGTSNYPLNVAGDSTGRLGLEGYVSDVRVIKGTAVYTSAFTPPTAPSTAITNTEALLSFTNAAMFDQTGKTNVQTVGNAQLDTSVKKFGTASAEFDGTGDRLILDNKVLAPVGTQSFTIECFIYVNANKNYNGIYSAGYGIQMYVNSSGKLQCWLGNSSASFFVNGLESTTIIPTSTWRHIALVRDSSANTVTWFVEGLEKGQQTSVTDSVANLTTYSHTIGSYESGTYSMNGYIDEFRITNKARYTSNFTAPTKEFPNR